MALISSEDYPNRRIYLSIDSVGVDVLPIDIYTEHRERRRLNVNGERNFLPMISAQGNEQIGTAKFTPRFTDLATGVKLIPYDTTHNLLIRGSLISVADRLEGRDLFDRSSLVSIVDVDYQPPQVEIITVATGGALTATQETQLQQLHAALESSGIFSTAALANAPGSLTVAQALQLLEIYRIHGLESGTSLTITDTSRTAGDISQTINDDGTTTTVSRP